MLPVERRARITEYLKENGKVVVEELAEALKVSAMTIRRDLQFLEEEGYVTRTYGGAILKEHLIKEVSYQEKATTNIEAKKSLAEYASTLVEDGYTIILDAGTTNMEIARQIAHLDDLKVITNDVMIAAFLYPFENVTVYCCGGMIQRSTGTMMGSHAKEFFNEIFADIIFMGAGAVDIDFGVTTPSIEKAKLKQMMMRAAEKKVLVSDSSKFGRKSFAKVCEIDSLDLIITDSSMEKELVELFKEKKLNIDIIDQA
ncbi:DeoR/GlpR family DNA-binding transcription regulator [Alkaliphilus crotonatoxidans]